MIRLLATSARLKLFGRVVDVASIGLLPSPKFGRALIQPRQRGGLLPRRLLLAVSSLCSKQREAPTVQDGGILRKKYP